MYERINAGQVAHDLKSAKKYYYDTQTGYLKEILETIGLRGQSDYLKGGHTNKGKYKFLKEHKHLLLKC